MPKPTCAPLLSGRELVARLSDAFGWKDRMIKRIQVDAKVDDLVLVTVHELLEAGEAGKLVEAVARYRLEPIEPTTPDDLIP